MNRSILPALLAGVISLALYAVTLGGSYVYDDRGVVFDEYQAQRGRWELRTHKSIWTESYVPSDIDQLYRPLISESYLLELTWHGDRPWIFHLVNILLNAGAAAAAAELARRLCGFKIALIAGLLFAVHPIHVEVAANIVGRCESACTLAMLGAMVLFLHRPLTGWRIFSIWLLLVIALLTKEQGHLLPLLLLCLYLSTRPPQARREADPIQTRNLKILAAMLMMTLATFILWRETYLGLHVEFERAMIDFSINPMARAQSWDRALWPFMLLGRYTQLLILPWRLSPDYGLAVLTTHINRRDPYLWTGFVIAIICLGLILYAILRRRREMLFCLLALATTYGMVSNVIIIGTSMGERLMFLPSVFFLILVAMLAAKIPTRILTPILMVVLVLASIRTFTYARRWNDRLNFYTQCLAEQPRSIRLHMLAGEEYRQMGMLDEARATVQRGCQIAPDYGMVWLLAARVEEDAGDFPAARKLVGIAMQADPSLVAQSESHRIDDLEKSAGPIGKRSSPAGGPP